jgi:hypothetical protein
MLSVKNDNDLANKTTEQQTSPSSSKSTVGNGGNKEDTTSSRSSSTTTTPNKNGKKLGGCVGLSDVINKLHKQQQAASIEVEEKLVAATSSSSQVELANLLTRANLSQYLSAFIEQGKSHRMASSFYYQYVLDLFERWR